MLTKYGLDNIIILLFISVALIASSVFISKTWISSIFVGLGILLLVFTLWFFRDPERNIPEEALIDESLVLAPADGKIVQIKQVNEDIFLKQNAVQISIFLSPLDVHVNRVPISGVVKYFKYNPGNYLIATHPKSSELNEQTHIGMENSIGKIFFKQIVGIVARRLVWDINVGDTLKAGQRFGMMKFGSRMDIIIPETSEIYLKEGQRVVAGETIVAKIHNSQFTIHN
ncbi:MAG: phosphatidylserine decarboxylase family protein [Bacteroidetes bacterium]|nr:phosphatidylserine decarboxylase family protein [Bacteroidota bacterium]